MYPKFYELFLQSLNAIPLEFVRFSANDKPWMTPILKDSEMEFRMVFTLLRYPLKIWLIIIRKFFDKGWLKGRCLFWSRQRTTFFWGTLSARLIQRVEILGSSSIIDFLEDSSPVAVTGRPLPSWRLLSPYTSGIFSSITVSIGVGERLDSWDIRSPHFSMFLQQVKPFILSREWSANDLIYLSIIHLIILFWEATVYSIILTQGISDEFKRSLFLSLLCHSSCCVFPSHPVPVTCNFNM